MVTQSRRASILLTRPAAQNARFAADLLAALGPLRIVQSPLLVPEYLDPEIHNRAYQAIILTSETGANAARRISALGQSLPRLAFCVGDTTAQAARSAGFEACSAKGNAADLIKLVLAAGIHGPLLHLHGTHSRGDIAETLTKSRIETDSAQCYTQTAQPLSQEARDLLATGHPVILPIFSPRTAVLLAADLIKPPSSPLWIAAISAAAAKPIQPLSPGHTLIAIEPTAAAMVKIIAKMVDLPVGP